MSEYRLCGLPVDGGTCVLPAGHWAGADNSGQLNGSRCSSGPSQKKVDTVFLVVLEDRHTDPDISVFTTREAADRCFDGVKELYPGEQWVSDEPSTEHWLRFEHTDDDGPNLRIEWHEVDGE